VGEEVLFSLAEALTERLEQRAQQQQEQEQEQMEDTAAHHQGGSGQASHAPGVGPLRRVLLRLDHMRQRAPYARTIHAWADQLGLTGERWGEKEGQGGACMHSAQHPATILPLPASGAINKLSSAWWVWRMLPLTPFHLSTCCPLPSSHAYATTGLLLFCGPLILIALEGPPAAITSYLRLARTTTVDVDAAGRKVGTWRGEGGRDYPAGSQCCNGRAVGSADSCLLECGALWRPCRWGAATATSVYPAPLNVREHCHWQLPPMAGDYIAWSNCCCTVASALLPRGGMPSKPCLSCRRVAVLQCRERMMDVLEDSLAPHTFTTVPHTGLVQGAHSSSNDNLQGCQQQQTAGAPPARVFQGFR
jgi:hypothetical protein